MKEEKLFRVIGMIEDDLIKEAEDKRLPKKLFQMKAIWKWTAMAAGVLLVVGVNMLGKHLFQNQNGNTSSIRSEMETAAELSGSREEVLEDREDGYNGSGSADSAEEQEKTIAAASGQKESDKTEILEERNSLYDNDEKQISLYAKVIQEVYQPYTGSGLYLDLSGVSNLEEEQKEELLEVLNSEYKIIATEGNLEELFSQEKIDSGIYLENETNIDIYLCIKVIREDVNEFTFQINCWGGRNVMFEWKECHAFYEMEEWQYELGEVATK